MSATRYSVHWVQYDAEGQNPKSKSEFRSTKAGAQKLADKLAASGTAGNIDIRQVGNRVVL